jgi:large subunit ribosomal protein L3
MVNGLLGKKLGMTRVFNPDGTIVGVTAIELGPCTVTQVKNAARDGYDAVQIGYGIAKKLTKPKRGHLKDLGQFKHLREFSTSGDATVGQVFDVTVFEPGQRVNVVAVSKGRGFAGGVKRHHFRGGPKTHGQSDRHRAPGSIGATTTPGRVMKGLRMAGHMGAKRVTVQNIKIVQADAERGLLLIEGSVPGPVNGIVEVWKARPAKGAGS